MRHCNGPIGGRYGADNVANAANPFASPSTLPYQAPRFDVIKDSDYQPAFEAGMKEQLAEINQIANNPEPPSFDNTIAAMERSGRMLDRVNNTFFGVVQANTNPTLDRVQTVEAPKLAAHSDAIFLNPKLFARVKKLYDTRARLGLDAEALQVLTLYYRQFVHAGALLSDKDKAKLQAINKEDASLETQFQQKLIAATKAGALMLDNKAQLAGLSDGEIASTLEAAKTRGTKTKYVIQLQNTTQQPLLTSLSDRQVRQKLFDNSWTRTEKGDHNDTRAVITKLASIRAQKAKLLGYPNYAAYVLYDQMANTPEMVEKFLGQLVGPTRVKAASEASLIQAAIDRDGKHFDLKPWDWQRYAEQVRKERYDLDENELKPYFEVHKVLMDGVFYAANRLYGLTFKERHDIPVYQPDVMVYEVFDYDGSPLGLIYFDYYKRDNKSGGAWMSNFVEQSNIAGHKAGDLQCCKLYQACPGQPALISFDDVTTMFHEFGHALHGLFANQKYPLVSGTNVARDFVEFPSQFNEHWALYPEVLKHFAVNYKTGAPIPQNLVDRIKASDTWGQGYSLGELLAASELDMKWHMLSADMPMQDVDAFETKALKDTGTDFANVPPRYRSSYFSYLGQRLCEWILCLSMDGYARRRCVCLV